MLAGSYDDAHTSHTHTHTFNTARKLEFTTSAAIGRGVDDDDDTAMQRVAVQHGEMLRRHLLFADSGSGDNAESSGSTKSLNALDQLRKFCNVLDHQTAPNTTAVATADDDDESLLDNGCTESTDDVVRVQTGGVSACVSSSPSDRNRVTSDAQRKVFSLMSDDIIATVDFRALLPELKRFRVVADDWQCGEGGGGASVIQEVARKLDAEDAEVMSLLLHSMRGRYPALVDRLQQKMSSAVRQLTARFV